ncbi:hypothetical protein LZ31DRAFT_110188 [Colletotrichum somersetense]|nr:hypothetical protein LZ31DRAFT_110188 [Colletotrichum somersetense]
MVGCRRCQQRGIRCVYDAQRSRGGSSSSSSNKQQGGTSTESDRPQTPAGHGGGEPDTTARGSGRPGDEDDMSSIQVAVAGTTSVPIQVPQSKPASSGSDAGSRSSGRSSNRSNKESAHPTNRPQHQGDTSHKSVFQEDATATGTQPIAPCSEDMDPRLFLDFTEEYMENPHENFAKLLDPFGTDGLLTHALISGKP